MSCTLCSKGSTAELLYGLLIPDASLHGLYRLQEGQYGFLRGTEISGIAAIGPEKIIGSRDR